MVVSGTGECLGRLYPVLLLQSKRPQCRFYFISAIREPAQPLQADFLGFTSTLPQFWTITFFHQSIPCHPPNVNIPDTTSQPNFSISFGRNFCEQQLVLGKLSNTVKWSTFCVSFVPMLTILGCYSALKSLKSIIS